MRRCVMVMALVGFPAWSALPGNAAAPQPAAKKPAEPPPAPADAAGGDNRGYGPRGCCWTSK